MKYDVSLHENDETITVSGYILPKESEALRTRIKEQAIEIKPFTSSDKLEFMPRGAPSQIPALKEQIRAIIDDLRKDDFRYGRYQSRTPTYVYEEDGKINVSGDLTFQEVRSLYQELGSAIRPSIETAQEMARAASDEETLAPTGVYDMPTFNNRLHPFERVGNFSKTNDGELFESMIAALRAIYATGEITARELRDRSLLLATQILSGQVKDPTDEFLSLERVLQRWEAQQGGNTTALAVVIPEDQALSHPIIRHTLPEFIHDATEGIMRTITGDRMGTDISGNKAEVEKWRHAFGRKLAKDYKEQWDGEYNETQRRTQEWYDSGQAKKDLAALAEKERSQDRDQQQDKLPVAATRQLAKIIPPPKFLERDYSGNIATEGQLGPIEKPKSSDGYRSRLRNSIIVPRQRLPEELELLLVQEEARRPEESPAQRLLSEAKLV